MPPQNDAPEPVWIGLEGVRDQLSKAADTTASVLLTGESGVGKEVIAQWLHRRSPRRSKSFVAVNVAQLAPTVIESEFFGHVKGAFTGANFSRLGFFRSAEGGTIFLDEIGELDTALQAKLLRVLQEQEVTPLGSEQATRVDVRVIAATNRDLEKRMRSGEFREDLYYRLAVLPINVPPLRQRSQAVVTLAKAFLDRAEKKHGRASHELAADAEQWLGRQAWPGNARELGNLMERASIVADEKKIRAADLERWYKPIRPVDGLDTVPREALRAIVAAMAQDSPADVSERAVHIACWLARHFRDLAEAGDSLPHKALFTGLNLKKTNPLFSEMALGLAATLKSNGISSAGWGAEDKASNQWSELKAAVHGYLQPPLREPIY